MKTQELKYTVIKNDVQYKRYCRAVWDLLDKEGESKAIDDEIELLEFLIEKYDDEHSTFGKEDVTPVEMLTWLMDDHKMKAKDLAELLEVSPGLVSDILHYKKGMSKDIIRKLADRFKMQQEAFNRPYELVNAPKAKPKRKVRTAVKAKARVTKGK